MFVNVLRSDLHRSAEVHFFMSSPAAFPAEKPGIPNKLSDQLRGIPLGYLAEVCFTGAVIPAFARLFTFFAHGSLPHVRDYVFMVL